MKDTLNNPRNIETATLQVASVTYTTNLNSTKNNTTAKSTVSTSCTLPVQHVKLPVLCCVQTSGVPLSLSQLYDTMSSTV